MIRISDDTYVVASEITLCRVFPLAEGRGQIYVYLKSGDLIKGELFETTELAFTRLKQLTQEIAKDPKPNDSESKLVELLPEPPPILPQPFHTDGGDWRKIDDEPGTP